MPPINNFETPVELELSGFFHNKETVSQLITLRAPPTTANNPPSSHSSDAASQTASPVDASGVRNNSSQLKNFFNQ